MDIRKVNNSNYSVLLNLMQGYEAEFSTLTQKRPQLDGTFALDTLLDEHHQAWLLYESGLPAGFAIIGKQSQRNDISEFYIVPVLRNQNLGKKFAICIFKMYRGDWQVRQIPRADKAT